MKPYATTDKQLAETLAEGLRRAHPSQTFTVEVYDRGVYRGWRTMVPRTWGIVRSYTQGEIREHQIGFIAVF